MSITHNPEFFHEPNNFKPSRFLQDGKFVTDVRVCPFSVGLRNCIGKQLAMDQYFIFGTQIVLRFKIVTHSGAIRSDKTRLILAPKPMKLKFIRRS